MESERLKRNLKTEIALALSGESASANDGSPDGLGTLPKGPSAVLLVTPYKLPRALVTDSRGVTTPKVLDYVDLVSTLDSSAVVTELEKDPVRTLPLPELPAGAILMDLHERPSGNSYTVTGALRPETHLFVLDNEGEISTHEVNLPYVIYRAVWDERTSSVSALSLALGSPDLAGEPGADTELYRWPWSNVYHHFGGVLEGVCWPSKSQITLALSEIPEKMVRQFAGLPNNVNRYTGDLSGNAPVAGYRAFLELLERKGRVDHDWLEPANMTVRDLHEQQRRKS